MSRYSESFIIKLNQRLRSDQDLALFEDQSGGGLTDFSLLTQILRETRAAWCVIGGLAVNAYVEEVVYTADADLIVASERLAEVLVALKRQGFRVQTKRFWVNVQRPSSAGRRKGLLIQFSTDPAYQEFIARAKRGYILGERVPLASLEDLVKAKIAAYLDPQRKADKRDKDRMDLRRLGRSNPQIISLLPLEIREGL